MQRAYTILIAGIWVAVLPYLGFPYSLKNVLFSLSGLGIMYFSYVLYTESQDKEIRKEETFDNFSENRDFGNPEI